ncbi:MAG: SDR family oxidoreductase [Acidimicrobiia bacterium]|nr:SDR family oxidoreductase [Acidimicrobiia bacterium]
MSRPLSQPVTVFADDLLTGQTALVTGGGTGLGRAIAEALARAGADLVLAARRADVLEEAADQLRRIGHGVETAFVDLRDHDSVVALADRFGGVDILVNNAGGQFPQRARDFSPNGWRSVVDLNLNGTWSMTQAFGDTMLDRGTGVICQIVMVAGRGFPGLAHSAAARAGVMEMTRTVAFEWGPAVRLNCVAPGPISTQGFDDTYDPSVTAKMSGIPLSRMGTATDVANAVVFLCSPAAGFITGEVLYVDGGQNVQGPISALPRKEFRERYDDER